MLECSQKELHRSLCICWHNGRQQDTVHPNLATSRSNGRKLFCVLWNIYLWFKNLFVLCHLIWKEWSCQFPIFPPWSSQIKSLFVTLTSRKLYQVHLNLAYNCSQTDGSDIIIYRNTYKEMKLCDTSNIELNPITETWYCTSCHVYCKISHYRLVRSTDLEIILSSDSITTQTVIVICISSRYCSKQQIHVTNVIFVCCSYL